MKRGRMFKFAVVIGACLLVAVAALMIWSLTGSDPTRHIPQAP